MTCFPTGRGQLFFTAHFNCFLSFTSSRRDLLLVPSSATFIYYFLSLPFVSPFIIVSTAIAGAFSYFFNVPEATQSLTSKKFFNGSTPVIYFLLYLQCLATYHLKYSHWCGLQSSYIVYLYLPALCSLIYLKNLLKQS